MNEQLHHGGQLHEAARRQGIPPDRWLDLSTGINPLGWPVPAIPESVWRRLPEEGDGLETDIRRWSSAPGKAGCVAVPGTQSVIQVLPRLRDRCRVGVIVPGYQEHARCWALAGHTVVAIDEDKAHQSDNWLRELDVLVWINPNNPTARHCSRERLLSWHRQLRQRGGWLIVDEAFLLPDEAAHSMTVAADHPGLVILKSVGKFFGLAGVRAGAVIGDPEITAGVAGLLGPWALSGPARYVMQRALKDQTWQAANAEQLRSASNRLDTLLQAHGLPATTGTALFRYVLLESAGHIAAALEREVVLVRRFASPPALRFGLPGDESQWQHLNQALARALAKSRLTSSAQ